MDRKAQWEKNKWSSRNATKKQETSKKHEQQQNQEQEQVQVQEQSQWQGHVCAQSFLVERWNQEKLAKLPVVSKSVPYPSEWSSGRAARGLDHVPP